MSVYRTSEGMETVRQAVRGIYATCPVPAESGMLDTGEFGRTHVLISGKDGAPPLVLLHGTSTNSAAWFGYLPEWTESFRIYALDIPGQPGLSDGRRPHLADGGLRRWLLAALKALELSEIHLTGMSLGGWMSLDLGVHHPERIRSMALLTAGGLAPFRPSFFLKCLPYYFQGDRGVRKIDAIVHGPVPLHPEVDEFAVLAARHFKPLLEKVPLFTDSELRRIDFPLLYIGGSRDPMLNTPASARRLAGLVPGAEIRILDGIAHVILDQGELVRTFIKNA